MPGSPRQKPHEETWNLSGCHWGMWPNHVEDEDYWRHNDARMKLAECAPEMARMLLEREWDEDGGGWGPCCSSCHVMSDEAHKPDCAWLALMKRAGVR